MTRKKIFLLALGTLVIFSLLGWWIVDAFLADSVPVFLLGKAPILHQLAIGFLFGLFTSLIGWQLIMIKYLRSSLLFFVNLIKPLQLTMTEIIFISLCAGIGEEFFFRGGIQPFLGIWVTAIIFVALHGYLNPKNPKLSIYGLYMTLIIVGMGYITEYLGILAAMMAHTVVDIVLLYKLSHADLGKIGRPADDLDL